MTLDQFNFLLYIMSITALLVFISLFFIEAGYGKMFNPKWGPAINNKVAWIVMESPVFFVFTYLWANSTRSTELVPFILALFFVTHYFQRSFIFPFLLKGKSKMPIAIVLMGVFFNSFNGFIQAYWLFFLAPEKMYTIEWLGSWQFILGTCLFLLGISINIHSDHVIRNLRAPGDSKHYLPKKGMYKYVTSANYFGEIIEWTGFAILCWSSAGAVFLWWTFANLVPRANAIYKNYQIEFKEEFKTRKLKRIFPYIY